MKRFHLFHLFFYNQYYVILSGKIQIQAVESVLYWKAMALRQGGDKNLHLNNEGDS